MKFAFVLFFLSMNLFAGQLQPIQSLTSEQYNNNAELCCFVDWGTSGWLSSTQAFPDELVYDLQTKTKIKISSLVKKRPIVLQMGSLTCPSYDLNVERIRRVQKEYKGKVDFYTVYVRENHPSEQYSAHKSFEQKVAFAELLKKNSKVDQKFLIDDVNGTLHQKLGNFGNAIYVIGKDMHVNHWSVFPHEASLRKGLDNLLAHKGMAAQTPFNGGTILHSLVSEEFSMQEKNNTVKKMQTLEGPKPPSEEYMTSLYEKFSKEQPLLYKRINPVVFEKMKLMSVFKIKNNMSVLANKATWNNLFMTLNEDFRTEYKKRYTEWNKINHMEENENVIDQILGK